MGLLCSSDFAVPIKKYNNILVSKRCIYQAYFSYSVNKNECNSDKFYSRSFKQPHLTGSLRNVQITLISPDSNNINLSINFAHLF